MTYINKTQQIERVDALIKRKATGSPKELATRLNTSERSIYKLIQLMKKLKAPIYFDQDYNSYCYKEEVTFSIGFQQKRNQIKGGSFYFFCSLHN